MNVFFLFITTIFAADIDWQEVNQKVIKLFKDGSTEEALSLATNTLKEAESQFDKIVPSGAIFLISNIGYMYKKINNYTEAESYLTKAINYQIRNGQKNDPAMSTMYKNLAYVNVSLGKIKEAETAFENSLSVKKANLGEKHQEVASIMVEFAEFYKTQKNYDKAELLLKQSLDICRETLGQDNLKTGEVFFNLADIYVLKQNYDDAEPLMKKAFTIFNNANKPELLIGAVEGLAVINKDKNKLEEAETFYKRSLELNEKCFGPASIQFANASNNLGIICMLQGKPEAETHLLKSLDIAEKILGPKNSTVIGILKSLLAFYKQNGKQAEADKISARIQ